MLLVMEILHRPSSDSLDVSPTSFLIPRSLAPVPCRGDDSQLSALRAWLRYNTQSWTRGSLIQNPRLGILTMLLGRKSVTVIASFVDAIAVGLRGLGVLWSTWGLKEGEPPGSTQKSSINLADYWQLYIVFYNICFIIRGRLFWYQQS